MGVIYLLTNLVTGRYYIGQTRDFAKRKRQHLRARGDHAYPINRAIRKYGAQNFEFYVLGEAPVGEELDDLERLWICLSNATDKTVGYNLRLGGSVASFNEETRERMRAACKLRPPQLPESRRRAAESMRGRKFPEHSLRMKGRPKSAETRRRLSESLKGHIISEETRAKISTTLRAKNLSMSEDHKAKVSAAAKKRWEAFRATRKGGSDAICAS
jgi:group I intron endonuclease